MKYYLSQTLTRIGRDPSNDVALSGDNRVSRQHAEIRHEGGAYVLRDLNSRNGTLVNGKRVSQHKLSDGDQVQVGGTRMTYQNGMLLIPESAVAPRRHIDRGLRDLGPASAPKSSSTIVIIAVVTVLAVAALLCLFSRPSSTMDKVTEAARGWVDQQAAAIAYDIAFQCDAIPLPPEPLYDKVHQQVGDSKNWTFSTPDKVAEDVYRLRATVAFAIPLTEPQANYNITAVYDLTINMATKNATYDGPVVQVR